MCLDFSAWTRARGCVPREALERKGKDWILCGQAHAFRRKHQKSAGAASPVDSSTLSGSQPGGCQVAILNCSAVALPRDIPYLLE